MTGCSCHPEYHLLGVHQPGYGPTPIDPSHSVKEANVPEQHPASNSDARKRAEGRKAAESVKLCCLSAESIGIAPSLPPATPDTSTYSRRSARTRARIILAIGGAWRQGHLPQEIIDAIVAKQAENEARTWPDWRTAPEGQPIEHVRIHCMRCGADVEVQGYLCCGQPKAGA